MPITRLIHVIDGHANLTVFHPEDVYAAVQEPDGTIILTPATDEQLAFMNAALAHDEQDFTPGVTIRPIYAQAEPKPRWFRR